MMNYSIIIPHRNIPQLLRRCLDSIPYRPDVEIIVVDDNSNPEIVDFSRFPGKERLDTNIILDKSGLGAGHARNIGMKLAQGKWLVFADADDFFTYCFNDVLDEYRNHEADIIFFKVSCIHCDYYTNSDRADSYNRKVHYYHEDPASGEMSIRYDVSPPWGKLIKHSLVSKNNIVFPETLIHEDVKFSYMTGHCAKMITVDRRAFYCLSYRAKSISYTVSDEIIIDRAKVYAERERFFHDNNIPINGLRVILSDLIAIRKQGKMPVYSQCLKIFSEFGFSNKQVEKMMDKELHRRKKIQALKFVKKWLNRAKKIVIKGLRV